MAEMKTKPTSSSVSAFLSGIKDAARRKDCEAVAQLMTRVTKAKPTMWGPSIVGFGEFRYGPGGERAWFLTGFSPRKTDLTLYLSAGLQGQEALMRKLGKHKTGKSCLYVRKLADVDMAVLTTLIENAVEQGRQRFGPKP